MAKPAFDMESAAAGLAAVVAGITDDDLRSGTPCADTAVRDLLAHVVGFTEAFRQAATKEAVGRSAPPAVGAAASLADDWRTRIPAQLKALVAAWRDPAAWDGDTEAGGVTAPAAELAVFALDELVIHGWDLACATGQPYAPAEEDLTVLMAMLERTPPEGVPGLFGPTVPVPDDAPLWHRVLGRTGRDPSLSAT
ncbi:TIGR03086 family metal-binding protein [Nocardia blacklockiae]|uniref:TIGR03086 family metal-binding protein n=1 Tax=Nocardia blacklockiae TaxID=480036 RepID=UPI0018960DBB|nr:TIGR03086 family metal-binding protein [Nocardia blacklockiae]MBF6172835.1 TIGR03086 family protein [Nocardia blacklockiae]